MDFLHVFQIKFIYILNFHLNILLKTDLKIFFNMFQDSCTFNAMLFAYDYKC